MSVGIGTISKGLVQQAIEKVANDPEQRMAFLKILKTQGGDWIAALRSKSAGGLGGDLAQGAESYFREQWLKFWPDHAVEAIVRQSLVETLELAGSLSLPIDCYWIWTNDPKKFEALIAHNARQVTRIILTPKPPTNPPASLTGLAPFLIVMGSPPEAVIQRYDPQGQWITVKPKIAQH